ncbi:MAG TPA: PD-(D/E)XK nuclease family protein [Myxococcaceae bacterium]
MAYRITPRDRAAFKRCRRAWDLGSTERQNREPVEPPRALDLGSALREALAVYYFPGMWAWDQAIVRPLAVEAYLDAVRGQQARVRDAGADETRAWAERLEIGADLLGRYFEWAPRVDHFTALRVAADFAVNLPDPLRAGHDLVSGGEPVRYAGTIDLLIQEDSGHWLVRHVVTQGGWRGVAQLRLDEEGLAACWAWESFFLGMTIEGVVYNELRIAPGTDRPHPGLFRRTRVPRTHAEIDAVGGQIALEAMDMIDAQVRIYPNASDEHCPGCAYRTPCLAMVAGLDPTPVLESAYRRRAPTGGEAPRFSSGMVRGSSLPSAGGGETLQ